MAPRRDLPRNHYLAVPTKLVEKTEEKMQPVSAQNGVARFCHSCKRRCTQCVPLILLLAYSAIGGVIFWRIESQHARTVQNSVAVKNEHAKNETTYAICDRFAADIEEKFLVNGTSNAFDLYPYVMQMLQEYARALGLPSEDVTEWTFWGSVFYSATVCTSIGYGNMTPKTRMGQTITMFYAIIGIPLVLYTLSIIGKHFCYLIWAAYSFVLRLCYGKKRRAKDISDFPFWLAVLCTVGWVLICAGVFCAVERKWDYFTSIYFLFQSLTTIGFGDVTPDEPRDMIFCFVFLLIGMGLVSMCWNLMQIKVEKLVDELMSRIREKYLQVSLSDSNLEDGASADVEKEIEKISHEQNAWLTKLMSSNKTHSLADEWRKKAKLRNKGTQTQLDFQDQEVDNVPDIRDDWCQTMYVQPPIACITTPFRDAQLPFKESQRKSVKTNNDELKTMLHQLSHILGECRESLSGSRVQSSSNVSNLDGQA